MKVKTGDVVELTDGVRTKTCVVLSFSKHHVNLVEKKTYDYVVGVYGKYEPIVAGYDKVSIRSTGVHMGFWKMVKSVNGVAGTS